MGRAVVFAIGYQSRTQRAVARRFGYSEFRNFSDNSTLKSEVQISLDDAVVVALGGNLPGGFDSVESQLEVAVHALDAAGLKVTARSSWWRSAAWPDPADPPFLNGVVLVETAMGAGDVLQVLQAIERSFGRDRAQPNAPRTLDLDLIAHGRTVIDAPGVHVPHPRAHQRRFVMGPLAEIAPGWRHPTLGETAENLAESAEIGMDAAPAG
jgi:2-amino-4-hydroxy-6-hydroxymethyldihydropteridine diphosphokinase